MCTEYIEGETVVFEDVCWVCAGRREAREKARFFLDHAIDVSVREVGS